MPLAVSVRYLYGLIADKTVNNRTSRVGLKHEIRTACRFDLISFNSKSIDLANKMADYERRNGSARGGHNNRKRRIRGYSHKLTLLLFIA